MIKKILKITILSSLLFFIQVNPAQAQLTDNDVEDYIWEKEVVINISSQADDLRDELSHQVQKAIAQGHLAPYRIASTENDVVYLWYHAGEPIYTFSEALKYLPEDDLATRQALDNYLKQEITDYPPYTPTAVYNRAPWLPLDTGQRREYYPLETLPTSDPNLNQKHPVIQTFYHLWNYVDATGDTQIVVDHWSEIQSLFDKLKDKAGEDKAWMDRGGCVAKYGDIAGCIGMARIAYIAQQQGVIDEAEARLLTGFNNGLDFSLFESNAYNENRYWQEPGGDDPDPTAKQVRTYVFINLFPETARFQRDYNSQTVQDHLESLSWNIPTWYTTYCPGFVGGEVSFITPLVSYPMFQAYAQILDKDPAFLRDRLDVPLASVGDLYYLQNLTATIKAYGQTCWEDIRTGEQHCESATFLEGDVDQDGDVDRDDAMLVLLNWAGTGEGDTNADDRINAVDFAYVWRDWGKGGS